MIETWNVHPILMPFAYLVLVAHLTITAMSLSFHRHHTHQSVKLHPVLDSVFQIWLWAFTSMTKRDWVSVHQYHHTHADDPRDPHSPVHKGFWHVFFLGAVDYNHAKKTLPVQVLRAKIPTNPLEDFIGRNAWLGPLALSFINLICFGFFWGTVVSIINLGITPLFAVGGVNALAHFVGYRNYKIKDNSRNLGFIFPLNWIICGELDHNNHHRYPKSPSFRRRWFEFDIGYAYLLIFEKLGLAKIARNPWRYPLGKPISITPQSASPQIRVPGL